MWIAPFIERTSELAEVSVLDGMREVAARIVNGAAQPLALRVQALERARRGATTLDIKRSLQRTTYTCGLRSAHMILSFHRREHTIAALARSLGTNRTDGTTVHALHQLFVRHGLRTEIVSEAELLDLRRGIDTNAPSLVSLDREEHWGVVYGYSKHSIFLADPWPQPKRLLRTAYRTQTFLKRWDRWAMLVSEGSDATDATCVDNSIHLNSFPPDSSFVRSSATVSMSTSAAMTQSSGRSFKRSI